jgi:acyl carrier protein
MGLDFVYILLEVEDTFNIRIPEEDYPTLRTVGDLYQLIIRELATPTGEAAVTSHLFYCVRDALVETVGVPREAVRIDWKVEELVPRANRRGAWQQLGVRLGISLPALRRPPWLEYVLGLVTIAAIVWGLSAIMGNWGFAVLGAVFPAGLIAWRVWKTTLPWATRIPPECSTVRALVGAVAVKAGRQLEPAGTLGKQSVWSQGDVWTVLVSILCHVLDVSADRIHPGARFIEDLGAS